MGPGYTMLRPCDKENWQCAGNQCLFSRVDNIIYEGRVCDSGHRKVSIVRITWSTLSGLILENIWAFHWDKQNCPLYMGVHIKWVSLAWSSTVLVLYKINIRPNCYSDQMNRMLHFGIHLPHHQTRFCSSKLLYITSKNFTNGWLVKRSGIFPAKFKSSNAAFLLSSITPSSKRPENNFTSL